MEGFELKTEKRTSRTSSAGRDLRPRQKNKKSTLSMEFGRFGTVPLESRMQEPSSFKKTWRVLTEDIIEPKNVIREESFFYNLQSLVMYILHFILVASVVFGTLDLKYHYSSIILSDAITKSRFPSDSIHKSPNFGEIRAPGQIWEFIRGVLLKIIYMETTNGTAWHNSVMMGVAQMRQVRVKKDTCGSAPIFSSLYKHCYGYLEEGEDEEPFGPNTSLPWRYSRELEASGFFSQSTGGFAMNFSNDYDTTVWQLSDLENNQWIRQGTRAVFLDFSTCSPDTNVIHVVNLKFEMLPWGGVRPASNIYALKMGASVKTTHQFILIGLNIVLLAYTVGLNFVIILRFKRQGAKQVLNAKNINDIAIISFTYITMGFHMKIIAVYHQRLPHLANMINTSQYPNFGVFTSNYELYLRLAAALLVCMGLKIGVYACYFLHLSTYMVCTFKRIKWKLICFTVFNIFILIGFSLLLPAAFGQMFVGVNTPADSLMNLILYHVRSLTEARGAMARTFLGPGYYIALVSFSAAFVYINCISLPTYVALVVHGWYRAATECPKDRLKISALEYIVARTVQLLEYCKLQRLANRLQERYIVGLNKEDFYPIADMLRRHGWKPLEICLLLEKHRIRKGDDLSLDGIFQMYEDLWVRNSLFLEVSGHQELMHDIEDMQRNVEYCESTIDDLKSKIETLLDMVLEHDNPVPHEERSAKKSIISRIFNQ